MGLVGFKNNLSNEYLKSRCLTHKTQLRKEEIKRNKFLTRKDFFDEFRRFPAGLRTFEQSVMKKKGFSNEKQDYVIYTATESIYEKGDDLTIEATVDFGNKMPKMEFYQVNNVSGIKRDIRSVQLQKDMIYVFTLDVVGCDCENKQLQHVHEDASFQLKVEQHEGIF